MLGDVDGLTGECSAFCHMNWLTTRGQYSGTLYSEALSSLGCSGGPNATFSRTVRSKSAGCCATYPACERSHPLGEDESVSQEEYFKLDEAGA